MKKKNNYRNFHIITIIVVTVVMLLYFIGNIFPDNKWLTPVIIFVYLSSTTKLIGPYEKKDELTKINLGRANGITLITVIAALFVISLIGSNSDNKDIFASEVYIFTALAAILMRSLLFIVFDRTPESLGGDE
ncbi:MAG: hypothetical protein GXY08_08740 [Ruminococcus sp.]|nr:hypothetical protein [Ruminococcus sp.]